MACMTRCCTAKRENASKSCSFQALLQGCRGNSENGTCQLLRTGSRVRAAVGRYTPKLINKVLGPPLGTWSLLGFGLLDSAAQLDVSLQRSP